MNIFCCLSTVGQCLQPPETESSYNPGDDERRRSNVNLETRSGKSLLLHRKTMRILLRKGLTFGSWKIPFRSISTPVDLKSIVDSNNVPLKFNFARDVFDIHAERRPDHVALMIEADNGARKEFTYSKMKLESQKTALIIDNLLQKNQIRSKYVLTILPRIPEWWFFHLGLIRCGAIFVPGTTLLAKNDIKYRIEVSDTNLVVTDVNNADKVNEAVKGLDPGRTKNILKVIVGDTSNAKLNDFISFNRMLEQVTDTEGDAYVCKDTESQELAQAYFTSGTTGSPKMIAHTHCSYAIGHYNTVRLMNMKKDDIFWNISDTGWAKSSYSSFFTPWIAGCTIYVHQMARFEARKILESMKTNPVTKLCAPPLLFKYMLIQMGDEDWKSHFKSLKFAIAGGEPLDYTVIQQWEEKTGIPLYELYGQTETTAIGSIVGSKRKPHSLGKISNGYNIQIVDDAGDACPYGTEGHIAIKVYPENERPIGLFSGYLKASDEGPVIDRKKTSSCYRKDFYLTGDRGYMDDEEFLFFKSREDDVIISAGYRIGPYEVETVVSQHQSVAECAAVASPDEERGTVVKVFVVLKEKFKSHDPAKLTKQIQNLVKETTAPYCYPRKVEFVDSLPKTRASNKILRRELRRKEYERAI